MVNVETYIKKDKIITSLAEINEKHLEYFVHFVDETCLQYINDLDYIEGVITISCDEVRLLDFRYWDLVDQLWSYLLDAICQISEGVKKVKFHFPDQPIIFAIEDISGGILLLDIAHKKNSVNKQEFISALLDGAESFFSLLSKCPDNYLSQQSKSEIEKIQKIKKINHNA